MVNISIVVTGTLEGVGDFCDIQPNLHPFAT